MNSKFKDIKREKIKRQILDLLAGDCEDLAEIFADKITLESFLDLFSGKSFDGTKVEAWIFEIIEDKKGSKWRKPEEREKLVCLHGGNLEEKQRIIERRAEELRALEERLRYFKERIIQMVYF